MIVRCGRGNKACVLSCRMKGHARENKKEEPTVVLSFSKCSIQVYVYRTKI